jgi:hypothetical protein
MVDQKLSMFPKREQRYVEQCKPRLARPTPERTEFDFRREFCDRSRLGYIGFTA